MRIWGISDLHLGFSTGKWMDPFGEHWKDHHLKVAASWCERVSPQDIVLMPGDFSWAMKPEEAVKDLRWLARLPGRKVLIKGNHDYWWPKTRAKAEHILPEGVFLLKKTALVLDGVAVVGVRGCPVARNQGGEWTCLEGDLDKEIREFRLSIEDLRQKGPIHRPPLALFHYPPFPPGGRESPFVRMAEEAGCHIALYGHLHTVEDWGRHFQGEHNGITYRLVSCDHLNFEPLLIEQI